jgi:outer membrane autotransporter protein
LEGTGTLTGNVTNSGTISPGASVGTLNIIGDVTMATGSTLEIEVNPTTADLLNITGSFTINPGVTLLLAPEGDFPTAQPTYTIVSATTGVSGTFGTITSTLPAFGFSVVYNPTTIQLVLSSLSFSNVVSGGNAGVVAATLDALAPTATGDLESVIMDLRMLNAAQMTDAMNQLQPAVFNGWELVQQSNADSVLQETSRHLQTYSLSRCARDAEECRQGHPWNVWIAPIGVFDHQQAIEGVHGYHADTGGAVAGVDYALSRRLFLGGAAACTYSDIHSGGSFAKGSIRSGYALLYGGGYHRFFFLNAAVMGARNDSSGRRHIEFPGVNRKARHSNWGSTLAAHCDAGLFGDFGQLELRPYGSVDYIYVHNDAFKEHGANSLNLKVHASQADMLRYEGGLNLAYCLALKALKLTPTVHIGWVREHRLKGAHQRAQFIGTEPVFQVTGLHPDRTLFAPGAGVVSRFANDCFTFSLQWNGEFNGDASMQSASIELSGSF